MRPRAANNAAETLISNQPTLCRMLTQRIRSGLIKLARTGARRFGVELARHVPPDGYDRLGFGWILA